MKFVIKRRILLCENVINKAVNFSLPSPQEFSYSKGQIKFIPQFDSWETLKMMLQYLERDRYSFYTLPTLGHIL